MALFLQELSNKLQASLAATQLPSCISMELQKLSVAMTSLEDAEKPPHEKSNDAKSWLHELQLAACDAYDFLQCLPLRAPDESDAENVVLQQTELIIKDIRRRVEKLMEERPSFSEIHLHLQQSDDMHSKIPILGIPADKVRVVGRDDDRQKMIQLLTSEEASEMDLSVIAIVGREGVGKSLLAGIAYNDRRVASHFLLRFWLNASKIHDTASLLGSITLPKYDEDQKDQLAGMRFLVVLDDFCNGVIEWERLCEHFETEAIGSKIVIIVEDEETVKNMGLPYTSCYPKELRHEDSWSLFKECACVDLGTMQDGREFEQVGMEIVEKLDGLPLAARMVGCLLCSNDDLNAWNIVLNSDVWKSEPHELYGISAALWLSYQHLPAHIKRCFAYCSVFPIRHIFDKEDLINMWIAQGLIQPQESTRMEDIGIEYFDYLVHRSFFQRNGRYYVMHKMTHKLAMVVTFGESLHLSGGADKSYENVERTQCDQEMQRKKVRYLCLHSDCLASSSQFLGSSMLNDIETLIIYRTNDLSFNYDSLFKRLTSMRVLYLYDNKLEILPESIAELKQLRFLDLSKTSISIVPEQVCSLFNLQTLNLNQAVYGGEKCPDDMSKLINLRHLKARSCNIHKIRRLKCLQDVCMFRISKEEGHKIEELKYMNQITGGLALYDLNNVHTEEEAKEATLNNKEHLSSLYLSWWVCWEELQHEDPREKHSVVLEALKPHPNLKDLSINDNLGTTTPSWLEDGSLCNLEALSIKECRNVDLLLLGQLQSLKSLTVNDLPALRWLGPRSCSGGEDILFFHGLRQLNIARCSSLTELFPIPPTLKILKLKEVGLHVLPGFQHTQSSTTSSFSLTSVDISSCHRLATLQVGLLAHQNQHQLQALTRLTITNCDQLLYLPDHGFSALESLKFLDITYCINLRYKQLENGNSNLPSSLIELKIDRCPHLINDSFLKGLESLHSLTSLMIKDLSREMKTAVLTSLSHVLLQQMKALTQMNISCCAGLELLCFESLVSLKIMKIVECPKLLACSSSADASPSPLEVLEINHSSLLMLTEELLSKLTSLRVLKLVYFTDQLTCFPTSMDDGLHCLVSLRELHIYQCSGLETLPDELASIPFLEELYIMYCPRLDRLPDKGVPHSLESLVIEGCRYLSSRCRIDGKDWHKIDQVPYVQVEGKNARDSHGRFSIVGDSD